VRRFTLITDGEPMLLTKAPSELNPAE